jgi:putative membrane protein
MRLIVEGLLGALMFFVVAFIIPGITIDNFFTAIVVFLIFLVVNIFVKPVIKLITLPLNIITLGLLGLVINVFLFWFIAWLVPGFDIANFWSAAIGLLLYTLLQTLIYGFR